MSFRPSPFGMPPVVKNLLIINVLFFFASIVLYSRLGIRIEDYLGLHVPAAEYFRPYQLITYMFLHAYPQPSHLFFNMFALFMFGRMLEMVWGPKRFLLYYMVTGVGAGLIQMLVQMVEVQPVLNAVTYYLNNPSHENLLAFFGQTPMINQNAYIAFENAYNGLINTNPELAIGLSKEYVYNYGLDYARYLNLYATVGASGAVFGILLAFGMLFPNTVLFLMIPPMPIKAKYFVIIYGVIELFLGVANFSGDNVAHFAHLGGMLFGFFLIRYWRKKGVY
ncbi:rhomboid family intramembrane serine protease [Xiashengella succiniciproducens]|jgi:membrane associated rhomboid family serine protease|uniref:Rhomboid family intramembrane serine protease n=1 Tax=Xiashengella succiniciproducens TaxID=2949635 RepID=A0A9J6ZRV6_9BACT|nr:rhomboid family intramembrane serine protease [Alkaliflexus sp. Ai-910]MDI9538775.1 rhomboid family intramembrane serine protease [Bacteroidota bacterium]URW79960.1 rhomboid family intramembrane serine protease [Alkaliflexus sp. Ai-910]HHT99580.1 rhomboid family intramembrane serine protease [Bacteroidales bacterium]